MGFLNDGTSGYKKLKNKNGLTNEYFYPRLCEAGLSFGQPELGTIRILGKESEAVVIHYTRRLTWGDCYAIESRRPEDQDLMVTVAVICDNSLQGKD